MEITVKIESPELVEALQALANAVKSKRPSDESSKTNSKPHVEAIEDGQNTESQTKPITLEQVRAKLAALSQAGKQAEVKALITEFGAKKLSDVLADKYPEILEKAEVL